MSDASRISTPEVRALTQQLVDMQRRLDRLERGQRASQLGHSSIDDGTLWVRDGQGINRVAIGRQVDGKFGWGAVNGDPAPRPNTPQLVSTTAGFNIKWNGEFAGIKPSDFTYVVAYASPAGSTFATDDSLIVGRLFGSGVIPVTALNEQPIQPDLSYWVRLVAYNTSGIPSEESFTAGPVQASPVVATEILNGIVDTLALKDDAVTAAKIAVGQINADHVTFTAHDIGGTTTYYQAAQPSDGNEGDLWADQDDGNKLYRYNGTAWVIVQDEGIAQAILDASQASADADAASQDAADAVAAVATKITTFYDAAAPTANATGDLWIETDQGNRLHRWDGSSWQLVQDAQISAAVDLASDAQATADGKVVTFAQTSQPTAEAVGDLWIDTDDDNKLYRWSGSTWAAVRDDGIGQAIADAAAAQQAADNAAAAAAQAISDASDAQATADGKVAVYYQAGEPGSGSGRQVGDLWLDTDNNRLHRWSGSTWTAVQDADIAEAIAAAGDAQSTADGKIETYWSASEPNAAAVGDLWYDTDAGNRVSRWNGTAWTALPSGTDAIADDAITSSKVVAEAIQALHIAAEQIFATHIAAEQVTGEKIAALAVVAGHIAANAIEAGHISAGAVTADKLEAILVLASQIIAGDQDDWHLELGDANTPILYWNNVETGFAVSRDQATGQANVYMSGRVEFGNGSQIEQDYLDLCEQPSSGWQVPKPRQHRTWIASGPTSSVTAQWVSATQRGSLCLMAVWQTAGSGTTAPNCGTPPGATIIDSRVVGASRLTLFMVPGASTSRSTETFGSSAGAARWAIILVEYTGIAASALDVQAWSSGTGTVAESGTTSTTTQANELQFAVFGSSSIGFTNRKGGQWSNPTNGFTKLIEGDGVGAQGIVAATKNATGMTAASSTITANKSVPWIGMIATFRCAPADGVPTEPPTATTRLFTLRRGGKSTPHVIDDGGTTYPVGRGPYSRVYLGSDVTLTGGNNTYAQSGWVIGLDPYAMAAISTSPATYTNITIPITGNYLVDFRAIYPNATSSAHLACFVTKNARDASVSIARDIRAGAIPATSGDGSPVQATRVVPLAAGDILYWGNWSSVNTPLVAGRLNIPTEITVHYLGPS